MKRVGVPRNAVQDTVAHLRKSGASGLEGIVLWVGQDVSTEFHVTQAVVPAQTGLRMPTGICVYVDDAELHRLNVWLFRNKLKVVAQVHSHPTDAYHSETDDLFPIATTVGCFSIVVPDFARADFDLSRCAVYRLTHDGQWKYVSEDEVRQIFYTKE